MMMKRHFFRMQTALLSGLLLFVLSVSAHAQRGTDFALLDQHGRFHQLSRYGESEAVVLFVQRNGDALSRQALPILVDLQERYRERGVVVLLLNPDPTQDRASVIAELQQQGVELPVLLDTAQVVARSLQVSTTAEAFILDPASHDILYRGALDSRIGVAGDGEAQPWLEMALRPLVERGAPEFDAEPPQVAGTPIDYLYQQRFGDRQISYQDEIVPILKRRCTTCHVEDGLAPWAMTNYRMIQGWSPMMREVLVTRRMPPGQIDMQLGEWDNIHHISDEELITLVHWIDSGARRQGDEDPLAVQEGVDDSWQLGEPDLIIEVPEEKIPATGMVDFRIRQADLDLSQDQWVRAVAYNVGDRSVLHSLLVFAVDPGLTEKEPEALVDPQHAEFISLYVPPRTEEEFAPDSGFLLRKDRDLSFKLRYVTGGRETVDRTRIGLYFRDSAPEYAVRNVIALNPDFTIAPGEVDHVEHAQTPAFERDVLVESFAPQTHTRGKSMTISAQFPDGREQRLINVANYNFNWQMNYRLRQRIPLPAGSRLVSETVYDNSASNPQNVDPEAEVKVGITTYDEIFSHFIRVLEPLP
ncbi:MAG: redoxin domain-containing protein [Pseudomonadales bacterium]|nr:redoxin domain-containing protein [Pseudomonadales bacterium]